MDKLDKLIALIPERLRSRKLMMAAGLMYLITQFKQFGIEIDSELQARLITWVGGGYITIQGMIDLVTSAIKAWREGGIKGVVSAAANAIKKDGETSTVDTPEG